MRLLIFTILLAVSIVNAKVVMDVFKVESLKISKRTDEYIVIGGGIETNGIFYSSNCEIDLIVCRPNWFGHAPTKLLFNFGYWYKHNPSIVNLQDHPGY
jgi:hypothetical protein